MNKSPTLTKDPRKQNPWIVRWHGEYDPGSGKQKRYSKSFRTRKEAETFQAEKSVEFNKGARRDTSDTITLGSFIKDFLETKKAWKPSTQSVWKNECNRLLDYFGADKTLRSIKPMDADKFVNAQVNRCENKTPLGRPLSMFTKQKIKRNSKSILQKAVEWQLIPSNPFSGLKFNRPPAQRWYRLRPHEYPLLLDAASNLRMKALFAVLYTAGLRSGEALALRWNDVDFEKNQVIIDNRQGTDTLPPFSVKTYAKRRVPLPQQTVNLLLELHENAPEGVPYVFMTADRFQRVKAKWQQCQKQRQQWQNSFMANNLMTRFQSAFKRAGIRPDTKFTLHVLRKNCIQNWADELPINVTKQLAGHATTETTLQYYNQVDGYHYDKAVSVIERLIERGNKTPDVISTPEVRRGGSLG